MFGKQTPASDDSGAAALRPACQGGRYAPPRTPPGVNVTVLKTRYVHGYEHQEPKDWCHGEGFAT